MRRVIKLTENLKCCSKCKEYKPRSEFYADKRASDGLASQCNTCNKGYGVKNIGSMDYLKQIPEEPDGFRYCPKCQTMKTIDEFELYKKGKYRRRECHECRKSHNRKYAQEHKEEAAEYRKNNKHLIKKGYIKHRKLNPLYDSINSKKRRKLKPDETREGIKDWQKRNRDKYLTAKTAREARRRARKENLPNTLTADEWRYCLGYFNYQCLTCGTRLKVVCDHWIPLSDKNCPGTILSNSIPLCQTCNSSKGGKNPDEWLHEKFDPNDSQMFKDVIRRYGDWIHMK